MSAGSRGTRSRSTAWPSTTGSWRPAQRRRGTPWSCCSCAASWAPPRASLSGASSGFGIATRKWNDRCHHCRPI